MDIVKAATVASVATREGAGQGPRSAVANTAGQVAGQTRSVADNATPAQQSPAEAKLAELAKELNGQMDVLDTNIKFGFDEKIDSLFISVIERNTGRVIRQIPSEEAMRLAENMRNTIGLIFDKQS